MSERRPSRFRQILQGARFIPRETLAFHVGTRISSSTLIAGGIATALGEGVDQKVFQPETGAVFSGLGLFFFGMSVLFSESEYFKILKERKNAVRPEMLSPQEDTIQGFTKQMRKKGERGKLAIYRLDQEGVTLHIGFDRNINWEMKSHEGYELTIFRDQENHQFVQFVNVSRSRASTWIHSHQYTTGARVRNVLDVHRTADQQKEISRLNQQVSELTDHELVEMTKLLKKAKKKDKVLVSKETGEIL